MHRSQTALLRARSLLLAGLFIVGSSTLFAGPIAAGRTSGSPDRASSADGPTGGRVVDRTVRMHGASDRSSAPNRPSRHITASALPKPTGHERTYEPKRLAPQRLAGTTQPRLPSAPRTPDPATVTPTNPATEAVSATGMVESTAEPPDSTVAAGPEHVLQATNEGVRISSRTLGTVSTATLSAFFGIDDILDYQAVTFDPHVFYDSVHSRWLATEASFDCYHQDGIPNNGDEDLPLVGTGFIDIAISDTADPTLGWSVVSIPYPDTAPDYPGLGTSTDKIVVSSNVYPLVLTGTGLGCDIDPDANHFEGTELDVVTWAQMMGTGAVDIAFLTDYIAPVDFGTIDNPDYFTLRPAAQTPATSSTAFGIGAAYSNGAVMSFKVTGVPSFPGGNTAVSFAAVANVDAFGSPPVPAQPSGTIANAVDGRPTDAVWQSNRLAFVSTIGCDPAGAPTETRDCVRVTELSTTPATPTKTQDMQVGETGRDLYMGGVGFSQASDLHVVWTASSATAADYPSQWTAYQKSGQTINTLTGKQKIFSGTAMYGGNRWGDYAGVAQDPQVPDAVWQAGEASIGGTWATEVSQLRTFVGASYTPMTPLRVMDSRGNIGVTGPYDANVPKTFQVAGVGGVSGIPSDAIGVTGNVTIVGQQAAGYVSVTPNATATPTSSTINFPLGDIRANNFTLPLGTGGKLSAVYKAAAGKKTHVIVDITGYFTAGTTNATYKPLTTPVRALDSRSGPPLASGVPRTLTIGGVVAGIPANATAVTGNLTVVGQTRAGYAAVTPDPSSNPLSSTINFPLGDIRANGLTADLNGAGQLSITYIGVGGTTHVILDITGYYLPDNTGLLFYPLNPGRMLESRDLTSSLTGLHGVFAANVARTLPTAGHWGVPTGAQAITGNLTVVGQTQAGYVSATPVATNTPPTSTMNFPLGDVRANGITTPLDSGSQGLVYKAAGGRTTNLILDVTGYFK